jgi:hypothetical protein
MSSDTPSPKKVQLLGDSPLLAAIILLSVCQVGLGKKRLAVRRAALHEILNYGFFGAVFLAGAFFAGVGFALAVFLAGAAFLVLPI